MTTNFEHQLSKPWFKGNIVIAITDNTPATTYFSQHKVDSGLTVDYEGLVIDASINGEILDLRDVKTSIPTLSFSLLDKDGVISGLIGADETAWCGYSVSLYYGFVTGAYAWANYALINTTEITGFSKTANKYSFTSKAPTGLLQKRIYTTFGQLNGDHDDSQATIDLVSATDFAATGIGVYDSEFVTWTGKTANQLTGVSRGMLNSDADTHEDGTDFYVVTLIEDESMNLALEIIENQAGVDSSQIDTTAFTALRDDELSLDGDFKFYVWNIASALTWLEENILLATNTRLINKENKISVSLLDQIAFADDSAEINEAHIIGDPSYKVDVNKVRNKIIVKYDYDYGQDVFNTTEIFTDANSITKFGEKEPHTLELKGVTTVNNGATFASGKAVRLLARLATPMAEIGVTTLFNRFGILPADQVFVEHRYLPSPGTGGEFAYMLEVMSKAPANFSSNPTIKFNLAFTSYANLRYGLISPSPLISAVTSQKVFTVPDGAQFKAGWFLKLFNDATGDFYADAANEIESIAGNVITMVDSFSTGLTTNVRISFPDYDESAAEQKRMYAYVCRDAGTFASDGLLAYKIIL